MLFSQLTSWILGPARTCRTGSLYQDEYRHGYVPNIINTALGPQIVAPDTPYVAASGLDKLYFISTCHDAETAQHIKDQIERASVPQPDEYLFINDVEATAEVRKTGSGETVFVFDPAYARVLFASGMDSHNPDLHLPELEPAGDRELTYNLEGLLVDKGVDPGL